MSTSRLDQGTLGQIKARIQPMMQIPQSQPFIQNSIPVGLAAVNPSTNIPMLQSFQMNDALAALSKSNLMNAIGSKSPLLGSVTLKKGHSPRISKNVPIIRLTTSEINKEHPGLYFHLYEAIELQCKQCALRFAAIDGVDGKTLLSAHLDWHFRQKKRQNEKTKKTCSRDWYLPVQEWIDEQPIEPAADGQGTCRKRVIIVSQVFFGSVGEVKEVVKSSVPAGDAVAKCAICHEILEKYFDEDEDMWMIKGAVQVGDKVTHFDFIVRCTIWRAIRMLQRLGPLQ